MKTRLALTCLAAFLSACATTEPGKETYMLVPAKREQVVIFSEAISRIAQGPRFLSGGWEHGLIAGNYSAVRENAQGIFFEGPGTPYFERGLPDGKPEFRRGGFWLPKNGESGPRLYVISGPPRPTSLDATSYTAATAAIAPPAPVGVMVAQSAGTAIGIALVQAMAASAKPVTTVFPPTGDAEFEQKILARIAAYASREAPARVAQATPSAQALVPVGVQDADSAERTAKLQSCDAPQAALIDKGNGFESFNVLCANREALPVRCESGRCKVLQ